MIRKIGLIGVLMAILSVPLAAYGQDLSRSEDINTTNMANNTFVLISEEDTGVPGYDTSIRGMPLLVRLVLEDSR
jgi:hypothetical protein